MQYCGKLHSPKALNSLQKRSLEDSSEWNLRKASSEFLSNKEYNNVTEALEMFKDDPLQFEPGSKFLYTTHGFTLVSAVLEKAAGREYPELFQDLTRKLGMRETTLDKNIGLIANRAKYYARNARHALENAPEVDCSYKWAGGGIISTVSDLLVFANAILYSAQTVGDGAAPLPLVSSSTLHNFWKGEKLVERASDGTLSALGWFRVPSAGQVGGSEDVEAEGGYWYHTGGAVGASSVLLIRPTQENTSESCVVGAPRGVCVAILVNMHSVSVLKLGAEIERIFREL